MMTWWFLTEQLFVMREGTHILCVNTRIQFSAYTWPPHKEKQWNCVVSSAGTQIGNICICYCVILSQILWWRNILTSSQWWSQPHQISKDSGDNVKQLEVIKGGKVCWDCFKVFSLPFVDFRWAKRTTPHECASNVCIYWFCFWINEQLAIQCLVNLVIRTDPTYY